MKTNYVYTEKAEQIARENNLPEYRKAGTAASFAYQPLENSEVTARAWLEAGIVEKVEKPVNFLTFTFADHTQSSYMYKLFKENGIKFEYSILGTCTADIDKTGELVKVDCFHVARDPKTGLNLFVIDKKPRTTSEYFKMHPEELYKDVDGWTREELLLCDNNIHAKPFCSDYMNALAKAESYRELGCDEVEILQRINGEYAVVSY